MKSIFVLKNYSDELSMTILKKLYEKGISYLDLEFFGKEILIENKIPKVQIINIMSAFELSKMGNDTNVLDELLFYGLSRNHFARLEENNVLLSDLSDGDSLELSKRFNMHEKIFISVMDAYNKFSLCNFDIPKDNDYSKYLLKGIKDFASIDMVFLTDLWNYMKETTYPIEYFNSDLEILLSRDLVSFDGLKINYNYLPLKEKVFTIKKLDQRNIDMLFLRLSGVTLNEVGEKYNLSRERVRQIIEKIYSKIGIVREDKYKNIYEKFDLSLDEFRTIFNETTETYYYLSDRYEHGVRELVEIKNENFVDDEMLIRINSLLKMIKIDDEFIPGNRDGVSKYYFKNKCFDYIDLKVVFDDLNKFIDEISNKYDLGIIGYDNLHSLEAVLTRKEWCVFSRNGVVRYYEMGLLSDSSINALKDMLCVQDGLYSSLYFYENNKELMDELDIRSEAELHNIIRNVINDDNIKMLRMPNILVGYDTKEEFFISKFNEYSPISVNDFLDIMRDNFGHLQATLNSYLFSTFPQYITSSTITFNVLEISSDEITLLVGVLNKFVYTIHEFCELIESLEFNDTSRFINNVNLKKVGYKVLGSFVVKDGFTNLEDAFYSSILRGELDNSIRGYNSTSYMLINKLERNKKIIMIKNKFYNYRNIFNLGFSENDVLEFEKSIKDLYLNSEEYFTVWNVREKVSSVILDNNLVDDSLVNSLIKNIDGIGRITWVGNYIYIFNEKKATRKHFMKYFIGLNQHLMSKELVSKLYDCYGIVVNATQVAFISGDSNIQIMNSKYYYSDIEIL